MRAHTWDGIGPKRDRLLLVLSHNARDPVWEHFVYMSADWSEEGGNHEGYFSEFGYSVVLDSDRFSRTYDTYQPSDLFQITHWADLPELSS